jgi:FkbM family methyltransferase
LLPYRLSKRLTLGDDAFADIKTIRGDDIACVFDVGAHIGQTTAELVQAFPRARIYSFEPDPNSYAELRKVADACPRITTVNAAVGDRDGDATFFVNRFGQTNSLLSTADGAEQYLVTDDAMHLQSQATVPVLTLDRFCANHKIQRIDVLKLDTQGYELRVLDGAREVLSTLKVPVIFLEVSFVRTYDGQPLFPEVYEYLYVRGYRLVWLYERGFSTHFYSVGANALFIDESVGARVRPRRI